MRRMKEEKSYVIHAEVRGHHGSPAADINVSMSEVTPNGDRDLDYPDQCESLSAYLVFDRIVKAFEPDAATAVDTVAEMLAVSALEAMVQDNDIVFPKFPNGKWMRNVLAKYPRLTDKALDSVKTTLKESNKSPLYIQLAEHVHLKMEPEDYSELAAPSLKEMTSKFPPYEGNIKHEINKGSTKPERHKKQKQDRRKNDE